MKEERGGKGKVKEEGGEDEEEVEKDGRKGEESGLNGGGKIVAMEGSKRQWGKGEEQRRKRRKGSRGKGERKGG